MTYYRYAAACCAGLLLIAHPATAAGPFSTPSAQGEWVDAHGDPAVVPAGYLAPGGAHCAGSCGQGYCEGGAAGCYGGGGGCYDDGSGGCYGGGGCDGMTNGAVYPPTDGMMDAFGGMGLNTEQCGPHYFDFAVEWVSLQRSEVGNRSIGLTSENQINVVSQAVILMSTGDANPDMESGFRLSGRYDLGALSFVEVVYTGLFDIDGGKTVTATQGDPDPDDLFSPFTAFSTNPPGGFIPNDPSFYETDRAISHSVFYDSELQSAEITYRRYWVGYNPRVSGTLLWGFRYTKLNERLGFRSQGAYVPDFGSVGNPTPEGVLNPAAAGSATALAVTDNNLAGAQIGGDGWITVRQGLRIGGEVKCGLYGNRYSIDQSFSTSDGRINTRSVGIDDDVPAFIGDFRVMMVADILPSVSWKVSYDALVMNSVSLAADNFNTNNPYAAGGQAPIAAQNQGHAIYNGVSTGIEYVW